jgi:flagella basal body P-ring formation protein FlgA
MRSTVIKTIALAAAFGVVAAAHADRIVLRASVRLDAGADVVRLDDVATIQGDEAMQYAELVLAEVDGVEPIELSVRDVRRKLDDAGAHWGRINLNGRKVIVRPRRSAVLSDPAAMRAVSLAAMNDNAPDHEPSDVDVLAAHVMGESTLRGTIAAKIVGALGAMPEHVRLIFNGDDATTLALSAADFRFELKPESSLTGDRVTLTVRVWSNGLVAESAQITIRPLVHVETATVVRDLDRHETITSADLTTKRQWLTPLRASVVATVDDVVGRIATKNLNDGDLLRLRDVVRPVVIDRGDRVTVRCLVGGVAISLQAEALDDGATGDMIQLRKLGERERFVAMVTAPGEAIVDLSKQHNPS